MNSCLESVVTQRLNSQLPGHVSFIEKTWNAGAKSERMLASLRERPIVKFPKQSVRSESLLVEEPILEKGQIFQTAAQKKVIDKLTSLQVPLAPFDAKSVPQRTLPLKIKRDQCKINTSAFSCSSKIQHEEEPLSVVGNLESARLELEQKIAEEQRYYTQRSQKAQLAFKHGQNACQLLPDHMNEARNEIMRKQRSLACQRKLTALKQKNLKCIKLKNSSVENQSEFLRHKLTPPEIEPIHLQVRKKNGSQELSAYHLVEFLK